MTASLAFLLERADWMASAACAGVDSELWFPDKGRDARNAKAVCAGCTVREDCLAYALARREPFGVWGGLSAEERDDLRLGRAPRTGKCAVPRCYAGPFTTEGLRRHTSRMHENAA